MDFLNMVWAANTSKEAVLKEERGICIYFNYGLWWVTNNKCKISKALLLHCFTLKGQSTQITNYKNKIFMYL